VKRRTFLRHGATATAIAATSPAARLVAAPPATKTLYNGIELPAVWPPRHAVDRRVVTPPYLVTRPAIVPIDVGRQLFVDDFLIEKTTMIRVFHTPTPHESNPVLRADRDWERLRNYKDPRQLRSTPTAMVFSDGAVYDRGQYKMWYMGGYGAGTCYAVSNDGVRWTKPVLDVMPGTNVVMEYSGRDSTTMWVDRLAQDPAHRYKLAMHNSQSEQSGRMGLLLFTSPDGIHWTERGQAGYTRDRSSCFYNPFRGVWVFSLKEDGPAGGVGRFRRYFESPDFLSTKWKQGEPVEWVAADVRDLRHPSTNAAPELYNLDCVAYESVLLGLFSIFRGDRPDTQKINEVCLGFSRDGFHWDRPDRRAFIGVSEDPRAWNHGNVQSAGGCCLVVGDRLHFYVSGRSGDPSNVDASSCGTGLFTLRRDGFTSMVWPPDLAPIRREQQWQRFGPVGTLTTRPIRFTGRHLFVNADLRYLVPALSGELRVEVLDEHGAVIQPFDQTRCVPVRGDGTKLAVTWKGAPDLGAVAGRVVRFRFSLTHGHVYAFWVSRSRRGESGGYVAAGGPGYDGPRDT
jgi:hypothetical protein